VANHIRNIVKKLGVATRMQAVVLATHEHWL
jgi:DNA-binding NarL/FixJ family response regulator